MAEIFTSGLNEVEFPLSFTKVAGWLVPQPAPTTYRFAVKLPSPVRLTARMFESVSYTEDAICGNVPLNWACE